MLSTYSGTSQAMAQLAQYAATLGVRLVASDESQDISPEELATFLGWLNLDDFQQLCQLSFRRFWEWKLNHAGSALATWRKVLQLMAHHELAFTDGITAREAAEGPLAETIFDYGVDPVAFKAACLGGPTVAALKCLVTDDAYLRIIGLDEAYWQTLRHKLRHA